MTSVFPREYEVLASNGEPMPDGLTAPQRAHYIALRGLYYQYRVGIIDEEQARREKGLLVKDYDVAVLGERAREKSIKLWNRLPYDIMKCQCEECRNVAKIIHGLN